MPASLLRRRGLSAAPGPTYHPFVQKVLDFGADLGAYWRLDDADAVLRDFAGRVPNGSYVNGPVRSGNLLPGDSAAAAHDFEWGSYQYAVPGGVVPLGQAQAPGWSFGCLARVESGGAGPTLMMFSQSDGSPSNNHGQFVHVNGGGQVEIGGWGGVWAAPTVLSVDTTYFIVATQNTATGGCHVYINGAESGSGGTGIVMTVNPTQVRLGDWDLGAGFGGQRSWDGLLQEAFVVKRVITAAEVAALQGLR